MPKRNKKMKTLNEKFKQLSDLARETGGASFIVSHVKETGKWKVVFPNIFKDKLQPTELEQAIDDAIEFILNVRKKREIFETFTLYN
jgi:Holliday junction resolvase